MIVEKYPWGMDDKLNFLGWLNFWEAIVWTVEFRWLELYIFQKIRIAEEICQFFNWKWSDCFQLGRLLYKVKLYKMYISSWFKSQGNLFVY